MEQLQLEVLQRFGELLEDVEQEDVFNACIDMVSQKSAYAEAPDMYMRFVDAVMQACASPNSATHLAVLLDLFHRLSLKVPETLEFVKESLLPLVRKSLKETISKDKQAQEIFWDTVAVWKEATMFPELVHALMKNDEQAARAQTQVKDWDAPWSPELADEEHRATEPVAETKWRVEPHAVAPFMDMLTYKISRVLMDTPELKEVVTEVLRGGCALRDLVEKAKRLEALSASLDILQDEHAHNAVKAVANFRRAMEGFVSDRTRSTAAPTPPPDADVDVDMDMDMDDEYDPFAVEALPEDLVFPDKMDPATTLYLPEPKGGASSHVTAPALGQAHVLCRVWNLPPKAWVQAETQAVQSHPIRVLFVRRKK